MKVKLESFLQTDSLDFLVGEVSRNPGNYIVILDLKLDYDVPDYGGLEWIVDRLNSFRKKNPNTIPFVVSAQLHEGIHQLLIRAGIPEDNIFDKGDWSEESEEFIRRIKDAISNFDRLASNHLIAQEAGEKIDPYLLHKLSFQRELTEGTENTSEQEVEVHSELFSFLVEAIDKEWEYSGIRNLEVITQIENIFVCIGDRFSLLDLEKDKNVTSIEGSREGVEFDCETSVPFIQADQVHSNVDEKGEFVIVGIVDSGIDVLHEAFLDEHGTSRIIAIWDQRDNSGEPPSGFSFGTLYSQPQINDFVKTGKVPNSLVVGERDHGTHVASIAAGRETTDFFGGVAPDAKIAVVIPKLGSEPGKPESLGYSGTHLSALSFLKTLHEAHGIPMVINISLGMTAGAHDGTSLLEKGFDAATNNGKISGLAIVKSAGNLRGKASHAKLIMAEDMQDQIEWVCEGADIYDVTIDFWFSSGDVYQFFLVAPDGDRIGPIESRLDPPKGDFSSTGSYRITYKRYDDDNGDSRLLFSLLGTPGNPIPQGDYKLEILCQEMTYDGLIHGWIERGNGSRVRFKSHVDDDYTLSVPGTAHHVLTVGATNSSTSPSLVSYSSYGPTRDNRENKKPDVSAPGDNIYAALSNSKHGVINLGGTSMAAPHVAGSIALLFSHQKRKSVGEQGEVFNFAQVQKLLRQSTRGQKGRWHKGLGYGIVDVFKAFNNL